jgi:hypothetical protein
MGKRIGRPPIDSHGTRAKYSKGCRCQSCRLAEANYKRQRRLGQLGLTVLPANRAAAGGTFNPEPGRAAAVVDAELESLPGTATRPLLVEGVRALARALDDPAFAASYPSMLRELRASLAELRSGVRGTGKLAAVAAMTARDGA